MGHALSDRLPTRQRSLLAVPSHLSSFLPGKSDPEVQQSTRPSPHPMGEVGGGAGKLGLRVARVTSSLPSTAQAQTEGYVQLLGSDRTSSFLLCPGRNVACWLVHEMEIVNMSQKDRRSPESWYPGDLHDHLTEFFFFLFFFFSNF